MLSSAIGGCVHRQSQAFFEYSGLISSWRGQVRHLIHVETMIK